MSSIVAPEKTERRGRGSGERPAEVTGPAELSSVLKALERLPRLYGHLDLIAAGLTAFLFVIHLFFDGGYFLGSGTDIVALEHPLHVFATSWMARGVLPLWNPFVFGGIPFQAGVHGYLYPGWWTGLLLPTGLDIKVGIALHLVLAAVGATWFARSRVSSGAATYLAGVTFALSAFFMAHLFAGHRLGTFIYAGG